MRIRCKPWAKPELEACPFYIPQPAAQCGRWAQAFDKSQPMRLEIGCGKGGFLAQEAAANPGYNYIAADIKNEMLVLAKRKVEAALGQHPPNVRLLIANVMYLREIFSPQDRFERIYINFCNPWPRPKHKKRRLTHPRQLVQLRRCLDGQLWFKTDDELLFEESIGYLEQCGFRIVTLTRDLHAEPALCYTKTEHEQMFEAQGKKIRFLIAEPDRTIPETDERLVQWLKYSERNDQHGTEIQ